MSSATPHETHEATPRFSVHANDTQTKDRWRASAQHLRRALRTLRYGLFRARRELVDGIGRAAHEVRDAARSLRARS